MKDEDFLTNEELVDLEGDISQEEYELLAIRSILHEDITPEYYQDIKSIMEGFDDVDVDN